MAKHTLAKQTRAKRGKAKTKPFYKEIREDRRCKHLFTGSSLSMFCLYCPVLASQWFSWTCEKRDRRKSPICTDFKG